MALLYWNDVAEIRQYICLAHIVVPGWLKSELDGYYMPSSIMQIIIDYFRFIPPNPNHRLFNACYHGDVNLAMKALNEKATPGYTLRGAMWTMTPFLLAIINGHCRIVELFLSHNKPNKYHHYYPNPWITNWGISDYSVNCRWEYGDGSTPLHLAAANDDIAMCEFLLNKGADTNVQNTLRVTPLMEAANIASIDIIELLLQNGAFIDTDSKCLFNEQGCTALSYCLDGVTMDSNCKYYKCAWHLIQNGANPNYSAKYVGNRTMYYCAVRRGDNKVLKYLTQIKSTQCIQMIKRDLQRM